MFARLLVGIFGRVCAVTVGRSVYSGRDSACLAAWCNRVLSAYVRVVCFRSISSHPPRPTRNIHNTKHARTHNTNTQCIAHKSARDGAIAGGLVGRGLRSVTAGGHVEARLRGVPRHAPGLCAVLSVALRSAHCPRAGWHWRTYLDRTCCSGRAAQQRW